MHPFVTPKEREETLLDLSDHVNKFLARLSFDLRRLETSQFLQILRVSIRIPIEIISFENCHIFSIYDLWIKKKKIHKWNYCSFQWIFDIMLIGFCRNKLRKELKTLASTNVILSNVYSNSSSSLLYFQFQFFLLISSHLNSNFFPVS